MAKWLAIGGAALLAVLFLLWREMQPSAAGPMTAAPRTAEPAPAASPGAVAAAPTPAPAAGSDAAAAEVVAEPQPGKLDPRSDEFFYKFDEVVPKALTRNAAKCYEGRHGQLHRNQKLSLTFKTKIAGGVVSVLDVKIKESTINDPALVACFIQEVQRSTWKDDELPDWEQEDTLVIRPERGMKKFWKSNVDYVGDVAPP